ncbi:replication initiation protein [Helicobacter anatolicus]|uniref:replication initiation protein n=1 Tax=Helicobacter anatolicus TaxID=2905874 RepID=UPI001E48104A|nr:replication initiation protein [Helicobacter anatolicus]MCE3038276.1 replication initiation protein [Helicobacter anatolicus]
MTTQSLTTKTSNKKIIKQKIKKFIVTQDNRFVYAKYDMNANEIKLFMWIIAHLNSENETFFKIFQIPISEIFEIWQWKSTSMGHKYLRDICYSMAKKVYVEDFRLLDKNTMNEKNVFKVMPIFKFIEYEKGQYYITCQFGETRDVPLQFSKKVTRFENKASREDMAEEKSYQATKNYDEKNLGESIEMPSRF